MAAGTAAAHGAEEGPVEAILEPDLPIVDAHHHLWFQSQATLDALDREDGELGPLTQNFSFHPRYLFDELMGHATSGHNVRATVYVEVHSMYRRSGPEHLRSVGEIEFANGMAAMAESGIFGEPKLCAGIVGGADLRRGAAVRETLEAQAMAGGGRYRGIRAAGIAYDERLPKLSAAIGSRPGTMADPAFREGLAQLAPLGLSCDIFLFEPQIAELKDLARAFPDTQLILNHVGMPTALGGFKGTLSERFPIWRDAIRAVAEHPNITIKLGGLGNAMCGFPEAGRPETTGSEELARAWGPYIETCIEAFGPERSMFESNFPVDGVTARYPVVWNTFKRIVAGASPDEKAALFASTAARIYRLNI
ncbi:amidohydrolase family protein [Novosphingobium sp. G106]|uniref:amidohydrolase family protein n=1 Tax=Novosphingobium sp. G106 TaxID=2849500 RepID=UPI001C2CFC38|nr:amidohydrolase family protein [Novosphingobium sp. G106]MBV1689716.1 amidohydrolase family protein [Novosphingobium sp. G106]